MELTAVILAAFALGVSVRNAIVINKKNKTVKRHNNILKGSEE